MPEIRLFYGIRITMNFDEQNPPHFHAKYAGDRDPYQCIDVAPETIFHDGWKVLD